MTKLILQEETYKVIGACIKVHKNLGNGFQEAVYKEALTKELAKAEIPFEQDKELSIYYQGSRLDKSLFTDFVCFGKVMLYTKATDFLNDILKQQALNYLKSTDLEVCLLVNFGQNSLTWKRFIHTPSE